MRIQPIQTYSNRIYSVRFMQSKQNKQDPNGIPPETSEKGRSHSPAGVLITAAALPAVIIYSLTTSPKQEIKPEPKTPDSTTYLELFNQLMESPLINMPKVDPHILLRNGYEWVSDGVYSDGTTTVKIDSDYYEIGKGDTEWTRPIVDGQGYSNIRVYEEGGKAYTDYRYCVDGGTVQLLQVLHAKTDPDSGDNVTAFYNY